MLLGVVVLVQVSPLVIAQEPPRPHSPGVRSQPQQFMPNLLNTTVPIDNLSSCSLPSLHTQVSVTLPVSHLSSLHSSNNSSNPLATQATTAPRVFEVETIAEDKPDSPDTSDVSINSSMENLGKETQRSDLHDSSSHTIVNKFTVQSVSSLESKSDSCIGKEPTLTELSTNPLNRYSQVPAINPNVAPEETRLSQRHNSYELPSRVTRSSQRANHSSSIPEHYCTTPALDSTWQRGSIYEDTYDPPMCRPSNTLHSQPIYSTSDSEVLEMESTSYPPDRPVDIDELPQASLLSEAFMRFMHSMSMVFRDPTFQPLLSTLDRRFSSQQSPEQTNSRVHEGLTDQRYSSQSLPIRSQHEVFERRPGSQVTGDVEPAPYTRAPEPIVSRSMTEPKGVAPESGPDLELRTALEA